MSDPWAAFEVVTDPKKDPKNDPWAAFEQTGTGVPSQVPQKSSGFGGSMRMLDNIIRQVANGMTFGAMDEIAAGANALTGRGSYDESLKAERARDAEFRAAHPYVAGGSEIAGAIASPINKLLMPAQAVSSLGGAVVQGATAGAKAGGLAGFLTGEGGAGNRLTNAGMGAGTGAVVGGAVPLATQAVSGAYRRLAPSLGGNQAKANAERILLRDLARDNVTPDELLTRSQAAGAAQRPAMLADLADENVLQTAQVVGRTPGVGRQMAGEAIRSRGGAVQAGRLVDDIKKHVSGADFQDAEAALKQMRSQSWPLWREAMSKPVGMTTWLKEILDDPLSAKGLNAGVRIQQIKNLSLPADQRLPITDAALHFAEDGTPKIVGQPNMFTLQMVKEGLDDIVAPARQGREPWTKYLRSVDDLRRTYVGLLKEGNPAYSNALKAWADPSEAMDAMNLGRQLVSSGPRAFEKSSVEIAKLDGGGKKFARIGAARALLDRLESTTDMQDLTRLNRMMGTPAVRKRLRALFDNDAAFDDFAQTFQQELQMARTNAQISPRGGSPTMPMTERAADLRAPPTANGLFIEGKSEPAGFLGEDLLSAGTSGGISGPLFRLAQRGAQSVRENGYRANMQELAPYLFTTDAPGREQLVRALIARQLRDQEIARTFRPVARQVLPGLAGGVSGVVTGR